VSGTYSISAATRQNATYTAGTIAVIGIAINGTSTYLVPLTAAASLTILYPSISVQSIPLLAGQTVTIQTMNNATSPSYTADATVNFFSITRTGNY
jgi:hypothetical protein